MKPAKITAAAQPTCDTIVGALGATAALDTRTRATSPA